MRVSRRIKGRGLRDGYRDEVEFSKLVHSLVKTTDAPASIACIETTWTLSKAVHPGLILT